MGKGVVYKELKVGDLIYLDPSKVRTTWGKRWAENMWAVEVVAIASENVDAYTSITGICSEDLGAGEKVFDADRILNFVDELIKIKRDSQRL